MDELLFCGIREFNEGKFFEAHDSFEEMWQEYRGSDRIFLQGLIHAAVGFYHLEGGNLKGANSQLSKACAKLETFQPHHWGLAVDALVVSLQHQLGILETNRRRDVGGVTMIETPTIQFLSEQHS